MKSKFIVFATILVIAFGVGGFYGGTVWEKSSLSKQGLLRSANNMSQGGENRQPGSQGPGRQGANGFGRGPNGGGFVGGEIISKDEKSITVKAQDGSSKIVFFSDSTSIGKSAEGSSVDLIVGQQVIVGGDASTNGLIAAKSIQIRPAQP